MTWLCQGCPVTAVTPRHLVRGDILSGAVHNPVAGDDGVGVRRPGPPAAAVHDHMAVGLQPGDHPPDRAVADVGLAGDRRRRWPAPGAVITGARVGQGLQDQALVA
jgi:hypothetical protein